MQLDVYSAVGRETQWLLLGLSSEDPEVKRGLELMRSWDGTMRPDSAEAARLLPE